MTNTEQILQPYGKTFAEKETIMYVLLDTFRWELKYLHEKF